MKLTDVLAGIDKIIEELRDRNHALMEKLDVTPDDPMFNEEDEGDEEDGSSTAADDNDDTSTDDDDTVNGSDYEDVDADAANASNDVGNDAYQEIDAENDGEEADDEDDDERQSNESTVDEGIISTVSGLAGSVGGMIAGNAAAPGLGASVGSQIGGTVGGVVGNAIDGNNQPKAESTVDEGVRGAVSTGIIGSAVGGIAGAAKGAYDYYKARKDGEDPDLWDKVSSGALKGAAMGGAAGAVGGGMSGTVANTAMKYTNMVSPGFGRMAQSAGDIAHTIAHPLDTTKDAAKKVAKKAIDAPKKFVKAVKDAGEAGKEARQAQADSEELAKHVSRKHEQLKKSSPDKTEFIKKSARLKIAGSNPVISHDEEDDFFGKIGSEIAQKDMDVSNLPTMSNRELAKLVKDSGQEYVALKDGRLIPLSDAKKLPDYKEQIDTLRTEIITDLANGKEPKKGRLSIRMPSLMDIITLRGLDPKYLEQMEKRDRRLYSTESTNRVEEDAVQSFGANGVIPNFGSQYLQGIDLTGGNAGTTAVPTAAANAPTVAADKPLPTPSFYTPGSNTSNANATVVATKAEPKAVELPRIASDDSPKTPSTESPTSSSNKGGWKEQLSNWAKTNVTDPIVGSGRDAINRMTDKLNDKMGQSFDNLDNKVGQVADKATDELGQTGATGRDAINRMTDNTNAAVNHVADNANEKINQLVQYCMDKGDMTHAEAMAYVKQHGDELNAALKNEIKLTGEALRKKINGLGNGGGNGLGTGLLLGGVGLAAGAALGSGKKKKRR